MLKTHVSKVRKTHMQIRHNRHMVKILDQWKRLQEATSQLEEVERSPYFEKLCKVDQTTVSRWRTGKHVISPRHARSVSKKTGFCVQYLREGNGPRRWDGQAEDHEQWIALLDAMSDQDREETLRFARFRAQDLQDNVRKIKQALVFLCLMPHLGKSVPAFYACVRLYPLLA